MKKKLSDQSLDEKAMLHLHFALGKAYSDQKKYSKQPPEAYGQRHQDK